VKQPTHPEAHDECCEATDVDTKPRYLHPQIGQEQVHLEDTSGQLTDWTGRPTILFPCWLTM